MDISLIETRLKQLINITMDNFIDQKSRQDAYQEIEQFKNNASPTQIIEIGFKLYDDEDPSCKHFGLQLVEHCIKFYWNGMELYVKALIKETAMNLIRQTNDNKFTDILCVKDALSRIIVEIIKREWPQQWSSMLQELYSLVALGQTTTELVLLILLRLVEDVVVFQSTPTVRRRQIMQVFNLSIPQLFEFFLQTIDTHLPLAVKSESSISFRLVMTSLEIFECLVDSTNTSHLIADDFKLMKLLIEMLAYEQFRIKALVCLLEIANRKGLFNDRKQIISFFFKNEVIQMLGNYAILSANEIVEEDNYIFLKRLCQVFVSIGQQLCNFGGELIGTNVPPNFLNYLEVMYSFTIHPSRAIANLCIPFWISLIKCDKLSTEDGTINYIIRVMQHIEQLLLKEDISSSQSSSCAYSLIDFETNGDIFVFQNHFRNDIGNLMKIISGLIGEQCCRHYLNRALHLIDNSYSSESSQLCLELEALSLCFENIFNKINICDMTEDCLVLANQLNQKLILFPQMILNLQSSILSMISTMFPLIEKYPQLLNQILEKVFSLVVYQKPGESGRPRNKSVLHLRRHACSFIIKISRFYPRLLIPGFSFLVNHINSLVEIPDLLNVLEKSSLYEGLILINNERNNFNDECKFIEDLLQQINSFFISSQFNFALQSVDNFLEFIGLTESASSLNQLVFNENRYQIMYSIYLILAILRRSKSPEDSLTALTGGFLDPIDGQSFMNPCHILINYMRQIIHLFLIWSQLYLPENLMKRHSDYEKCFDIKDADKKCYLGMSLHTAENEDKDNVCDKTPVDKMHTFLLVLPENIMNLIGNCLKNLTLEAYRLPEFTVLLNKAILTSFNAVPDLKLHYIFTHLLKPLLVSCPCEYWQETLRPLFNQITIFMCQKLTHKWKCFFEKYKHCIKADDDNREIEDLFEEFTLRCITRSYLDFIDLALRDNNSKKEMVAPAIVKNEDEDDMEMMDDDQQEHQQNQLKKNKEEIIGKLGLYLLQPQDIATCLLWSVFYPLVWDDMTSCLRAVVWTYPLLKNLVTDNKLNADLAENSFSMFVEALRINGQHEATLYTILHQMLRSYELLASQFPSIRQIMLQISTCTVEGLNTFESRYLNCKTPQKNYEKKKRDSFRYLVEGAIGVNIGQLYKNDVYIKNLKPFYINAKIKQSIIDEGSGLCNLFAGEN